MADRIVPSKVSKPTLDSPSVSIPIVMPASAMPMGSTMPMGSCLKFALARLMAGLNALASNARPLDGVHLALLL
ncbi:hypothetical protein [Mesorhizobium tianshanense]|uniref:hypothetical protein n=1 Tax=Mesorhizobium tianshanense TaxID=39844 RepID=UPI0011A58C23|nr:hypothetical protein [Mesorhizobium tianshanense]